jgi:hypothetical protein
VSGDLFTHAAAAGETPRGTPAAARRGRKVPFIVYEGDGGARTINPRGRDAWMLGELIEAGSDGLTSLENPAPRISHYVFKLRRIYGLNVETIDEPHGGDFKGTHARYVLRSRVTSANPAAADRHGGDQ